MTKSFRIFAVIAVAASMGCGRAKQPGWLDRSETLEELGVYRAGLSLYDGAPLVIPHAVESLGRENCLNCHAPGSLENDERIALPHPHTDWIQCRQCHVERSSSEQFAASDFQPLRWQTRSVSRKGNVPLMIPHHVQNRENCSVCHIGDQSHPALRAGHGYRASCLQCHLQQVGQ